MSVVDPKTLIGDAVIHFAAMASDGKFASAIMIMHYILFVY